MELTKKDESIVETQTKLQNDNQQASKDLAKVQKKTLIHLVAEILVDTDHTNMNSPETYQNASAKRILELNKKTFFDNFTDWISVNSV